MTLDLQSFSSKLKRFRDQLQLSLEELTKLTGIPNARLQSLESGKAVPTGDEVLIFADVYKCDYQFFVSNERLAPFEQTEHLYRRYGDKFSKEDRWTVQEFLFLCECEESLTKALERAKEEFRFECVGQYFKGHAEDAAICLRRHFGYADNAVPLDIYADFRRIGIHVFRRRLDNSNISGLTVRHPTAGPCILINYSEDIYRQRFTAAHEAAHALLDKQEDVVVSFTDWNKVDLIEIRANTFASRYLLPPIVLKRLPVMIWNHSNAVQWATKLKVNTTTLAIGLKENGIIDEAKYQELIRVKVAQDLKSDPEFEGLTAKARQTKKALMERGLSSLYVSLCFDAISKGVITNAKAAEMLVVPEDELSELAEMFHVKAALHE